MILVTLFWVNHSFFVRKWVIRSKKQVICSFAHLRVSWATWANRSQSLICHERPERFAHRRSFVGSDQRESFTVAHLIWAIWANEQMSDEWNPNTALACLWLSWTFLDLILSYLLFTALQPKFYILRSKKWYEIYICTQLDLISKTLGLPQLLWTFLDLRLSGTAFDCLGLF